MKKHLSLPLVAALAVLFILPWVAFAQEYTLLEPLPGTGIGEKIPINSQGLSNYVQRVFNIGIGVAIALAVVMIVFGGIQYLSTDAIGKKKEGLEKLQDALIGLLLALGAYVIIATINPDILKFNLAIAPLPKAEIPAPKEVVYATCPDCAEIPTGILVKETACDKSKLPANQKRCRVNTGLARDLLLLNGKLNNSNIVWQVTEAWPPTVQHKSRCHGDGRCIDANLIGERTPITVANINAFCQAAKDFGMTVAYEVPNQSEKNRLAGVTCPVFRIVPGISASHFHFPEIRN